MNNVRIDGDRLWRSLMTMAEIGATEKGGVRRLALTAVDRAARDLFVRWCQEAGCTVSIDAIGNIFARRPGRDPLRPPVLVGSHLDSQPTGGKFDGAYGVLAALELIRSLNDAGIETEAAIEAVDWTNEEGSRFQPSMVGSAAFSGAINLGEARAARDAEGMTLGQAVAGIGYEGPLGVGGRPVGAYFEAHIEQGPILEAEGRTIGVVTGAQGQRWYEVTVVGQEAHAGPTPMPARRDALVGAARMIDAVRRIGDDAAPHGRSTCGYVEVHPNSRSVIPGRVFLALDLRHPDDDTLAAMDTALRQAGTAIGGAEKLDIAIRQVRHFPAQPFDPRWIGAVRGAAERLGLPHMDIVSGAGHDAVHMARMTPTAMVFVPCEGGISHAEIENAAPADLAAGCDVLLQVVLEAAGGDS